jgi:hypothetical protein
MPACTALGVPIAMTLDVYSAYVPTMGRDAAAQLDALRA